MCPGQHWASPCVEIEVIGVAADNAKEKTKVISASN